MPGQIRGIPVSPIKRRAYRAIENDPGHAPGSYGFAAHTIHALATNGLIEYDHEGNLYLPVHEHRWVWQQRVKHCHSLEDYYVCPCGAKAGMYYDVIPALVNGATCKRCRELIEGRGIGPRHYAKIVRPH